MNALYTRDPTTAESQDSPDSPFADLEAIYQLAVAKRAANQCRGGGSS
jgi:hypothetical protein